MEADLRAEYWMYFNEKTPPERGNGQFWAEMAE